MSPKYYFPTSESQESHTKETAKSAFDGARESGRFAKACSLGRRAESTEDLDRFAASAITGERCPSVYHPSTLSPYTPRGRAARKPIRHLKPDQALTTPQLLKFQPRRAWKHLKPNERLALIAQTVLLSEAVAFSLNFGADLETKLKNAGEGARKLLSDRIRKRLGESFDTVPELSFIFEFDGDGRLHAHGIAILADHTRKTKASFRQALKEAGGQIDSKARDYQLDVRPMWSNGWRDYLAKDTANTIAALGTDKIAYTSQSMSRLAKEAHEAHLERLKAKKARANIAPVADRHTETHTESPASEPADDSLEAVDRAPWPSMAVSAKGSLPASLIDEIEDMLDGL